MLEVETRIAAERNTLLGLQNELTQLERDLWSDPQASAWVEKRLSCSLDRLSGSLSSTRLRTSING